MFDERRQLKLQRVPGTPLLDTRGNAMDTIHTIKLPTRHSAPRRSEPVPISVAVAEAYAAITARGRQAARHLRAQTSQALRKVRATA